MEIFDPDEGLGISVGFPEQSKNCWIAARQSGWELSVDQDETVSLRSPAIGVAAGDVLHRFDASARAPPGEVLWLRHLFGNGVQQRFRFPNFGAAIFAKRLTCGGDRSDGAVRVSASTENESLEDIDVLFLAASGRFSVVLSLRICCRYLLRPYRIALCTCRTHH